MARSLGLQHGKRAADHILPEDMARWRGCCPQGRDHLRCGRGLWQAVIRLQFESLAIRSASSPRAVRLGDRALF